MAILLSNFVWEGTRPERLAGVDAEDGHIYKELDTGESYLRRNGEWQFINLGLSFIKATKSGTIVTDSNGKYSVFFTTPLIDTDYSVALSCVDGSNAAAFFSNIGLTGFGITTRNPRTNLVVGNVQVSWLVTRNYNP